MGSKARVYLHNFSNFDAIFLIKILSHLSNNIKPIIRKNKNLDIKSINSIIDEKK